MIKSSNSMPLPTTCTGQEAKGRPMNCAMSCLFALAEAVQLLNSQIRPSRIRRP